MNIQYLRQSLKRRWLSYYQENREWIDQLGVWVDCGGQRRPSSSFILGTLASLEPQLTQLLPLVVSLSNNPDRIILALGLNFNPNEELKTLQAVEEESKPVKMLPSQSPPALEPLESSKSQKLPSLIDESCEGARYSGAARDREAGKK